MIFVEYRRNVAKDINININKKKSQRAGNKILQGLFKLFRRRLINAFTTSERISVRMTTFVAFTELVSAIIFRKNFRRNELFCDAT